MTSLEVVEVTDADLQKAWKEAVAKEQVGQPVTKAVAVGAAPGAWKSWGSKQIWVRNPSGHSVIVYVSRFNPIKDVIEWAAKANANAQGAGVEAQLKYAHSQGRLQVISMTARELEPIGQAFSLGAGAKGAYVTVALEGDRSQLLCKDYMVECKHVLKVGGKPFADNVLIAGQ